jgi:hypothetical protein
MTDTKFILTVVLLPNFASLRKNVCVHDVTSECYGASFLSSFSAKISRHYFWQTFLWQTLFAGPTYLVSVLSESRDVFTVANYSNKLQ